ncbi:hypothetical protein GCM10010520_55710 [Rhizobium viscosum]
MDIVKHVARMETIPVVIITGERIEEADKAIGLEFGADDYIEKPFGLREFIARIGVCLRRPLPEIERKPERIFRFSGWSLNMRLRSLHDPAGVRCPLTPNEFRVLSTFLQSPQTILSRDQLSRGRDAGADRLDERSIDVVVNRLRRKLRGDGQAAPMIETERGVGYCFAPSVQQSVMQSRMLASEIEKEVAPTASFP